MPLSLSHISFGFMRLMSSCCILPAYAGLGGSVALRYRKTERRNKFGMHKDLFAAFAAFHLSEKT